MLAGATPPRTGLAYFWTDQFGRRLQVVGRVGPQLTAEVAQADGRFVARYRTAQGRLAGVALLDRPDLLSQARAEILASPRGAETPGRVAA
jgi:hypothetical protein